MRSRKKKGLKGFTLIELLVVIGIIAVLVALLVPTITNARKRSTGQQVVNVLIRDCEDAKNYLASGGTAQTYVNNFTANPDRSGLPGNLPPASGTAPGWGLGALTAWSWGVTSPAITQNGLIVYVEYLNNQSSGNDSYDGVTAGKFRFGNEAGIIVCMVSNDPSDPINYYALDGGSTATPL